MDADQHIVKKLLNSDKSPYNITVKVFTFFRILESQNKIKQKGRMNQHRGSMEKAAILHG